MRTIYWLCLLIPLFSQPALAMHLQAGLALMDEGDDRIRGGLQVQAGMDPWVGRFYYFERSFGPVTQRTQLLALAYSIGFPGLPMLSVELGTAPLLESTTLAYSSAVDQGFARNENQFNLGFFCGVYWRYQDKGPLNFQISWDSALYPAGLTGGLFLATGRKEFLTFAIGVNL